MQKLFAYITIVLLNKAVELPALECMTVPLVTETVGQDGRCQKNGNAIAPSYTITDHSLYWPWPILSNRPSQTVELQHLNSRYLSNDIFSCLPKWLSEDVFINVFVVAVKHALSLLF